MAEGIPLELDEELCRLADALAQALAMISMLASERESSGALEFSIAQGTLRNAFERIEHRVSGDVHEMVADVLEDQT